MNTKILLFAIFSTVLFSCGSDEKVPMTYVTDFDSFFGWTDHPALRKGNARSGEWFTIADRSNPYTLSFHARSGEISQRPLKKVNVNFWAMVTSLPCQSKLVVSADDTSGSVFWEGKRLDSLVTKKNEWVEVKYSFDLPVGKIGPDHMLKAYIWASDKRTIMIDDMTVGFEN
ncbi:MAG: hypothetical protein ACKOQ6_02105 [Bacteroidota bacterium]